MPFWWCLLEGDRINFDSVENSVRVKSAGESEILRKCEIETIVCYLPAVILRWCVRIERNIFKKKNFF